MFLKLNMRLIPNNPVDVAILNTLISSRPKLRDDMDGSDDSENEEDDEDDDDLSPMLVESKEAAFTC